MQKLPWFPHFQRLVNCSFITVDSYNNNNTNKKWKYVLSCSPVKYLFLLWLQETCPYNTKSRKSTNSHQQVSSVHEEGIDQPQHCICSLSSRFTNKRWTYGATSMKSHRKKKKKKNFKNTYRKKPVSTFIAMEPQDLLAHLLHTERLTNIVPLCLMNETCLHLHWVYVLVSR